MTKIGRQTRAMPTVPPNAAAGLGIGAAARVEAEACQFMAALFGARTRASCADLFRAAIKPYGFDTFAAGEIDPGNRDRCVFYIIEWTERWRRFYLQSGLVENDPIIEAATMRAMPFTWEDLRRERQVAQLGTAALDLSAAEGYVEGFVVPLARGNGRIGLVSMAGREKMPGAAARSFLWLISIALDSHVRSLVATDGFAVPPMGLTDREVECLRLVAAGHTDKAIAQSMGVKPSTAHEFVEKAKRRLQASSRAEMIALAVSLGIIDV